MSRKKLDFRADAFRNVLGFTFRHWQGQPWRVAVIALLVLLATIGPYCYSMRLWVQPAMVSLNRLVASSRAPVLAHTMEALRGVPVIHA